MITLIQIIRLLNKTQAQRFYEAIMTELLDDWTESDLVNYPPVDFIEDYLCDNHSFEFEFTEFQIKKLNKVLRHEELVKGAFLQAKEETKT